MKTKLTEENGSNSINLINRKTGHWNSPPSYWILQWKWRKQMVCSYGFIDYGWYNVKCTLVCFYMHIYKRMDYFPHLQDPLCEVWGCRSSCPCQAEALIHQGEPNWTDSVPKNQKRKTTRMSFFLLFMVWYSSLHYDSDLMCVQQWFSVYKILCCNTILWKWNAFKTSKGSWVSWGDFRESCYWKQAFY